MAHIAEALELLFSAPNRWTTLRGVAVRTVEPEHPSGDPGQREVRVWLAPERRRRSEEEIELDGNRGTRVLVADGSEWWERQPGQGVTVGSGWPPPSVGVMSDLEAFVRGLGWFDLEVAGERVHLHRSCLVLRAMPRPPLTWLCGCPPLPGDEHEVLVDMERGIVLRLESRTAGRRLAVTELAEVSFDEEFPEGTFAGPPPGEEARTAEERHAAFFISLDEAVARAPFSVLVPARLPEEACLDTVWLGRRADSRHTTVGLAYDLHRARHLLIEEAGSPDALGSPAGWEHVPLDDGGAVFVHEPSQNDSSAFREAWIERDGTSAVVSLSAVLGRAALLDVVASLRAPKRRDAGGRG